MGAFSSKGRNTIAFLGGIRNTEDYCYTVENYLLAITSKTHPEGSTFQENNTGIHKCRATMEWIDAQNINLLL